MDHRIFLVHTACYIVILFCKSFNRHVCFSSWRIVSFCGIAPCCITMLALIILPETPYWLIENNQLDEARKSLHFFRGRNYDTDLELNEIQEKHLSKLQNSKSYLWILKRLCSRAFFKPFSCIGILEGLYCLTGFDVVIVYMISNLKETGSSIDPNLGPIIVGIVRFISAGKYVYLP